MVAPEELEMVPDELDVITWFLVMILRWSRVDISQDVVETIGHNHTAPDKFIWNYHIGISQLMEWCKSQCKSIWLCRRNATFLFQSKKDAAIFKLTWF
jgi:hypothetical protein